MLREHIGVGNAMLGRRDLLGTTGYLAIWIHRMQEGEEVQTRHCGDMGRRERNMDADIGCCCCEASIVLSMALSVTPSSCLNNSE